MQRRDLNAPDAYHPVAAYTQAIEVSGTARTLYISGQIGQRMDGTIPDDIVEQSRLACGHRLSSAKTRHGRRAPGLDGDRRKRLWRRKSRRFARTSWWSGGDSNL